MRLLLVALLALLACPMAGADGITGSAIRGGQPACPDYVIIGVFHPAPAEILMGCRHVTGPTEPVVVVFQTAPSLVTLTANQQVRFQRGRGYYAYPP